MEVHTHTHTARKKWTHYFWEFLMLFLAVTLGFFVENQREHYVENLREKQFVRSLFNDIKTDTMNLGRVINARTRKDQMLDSLSYLMNSSSPGDFTTRIYYYAIGASRTRQYRFVSNDATMQQLKNSGALRLIRKRAVADSIARYDLNVRNMMAQLEVEENNVDHYRTAAAKIFDALVFEQMIDENSNIVRLPAGKPALQAYDKRELYEWNFRLYGIRSINKGNRRELKSLLQQAENLLALMKKEYRLE